MKSILLVAAGGAIGCVLRYFTGLAFRSQDSGNFPWATLTVNLTGCLCIGILYAWSMHHFTFDNLRLFLIVGLLGGFTTFSGFGIETFNLVQDGKHLYALSYVLLSNMLGIALVWAGYFLFSKTQAL